MLLLAFAGLVCLGRGAALYLPSFIDISNLARVITPDLGTSRFVSGRIVRRNVVKINWTRSAGENVNFIECSVYMEGCTFSEAIGFGSGYHSFGGAMYFSHSEVRLKECTLEYCQGVCGGGLFMLSSMSVLEGCSFVANRAMQNGGGLGVASVNGDNIQEFCVLTSCTFDGCMSDCDGGGLSATSIPEIVIERTEFKNCKAGRGGGAVLLSKCQLYVARSFFYKNLAGSSSDFVNSTWLAHGKYAKRISAGGGGAILFDGEGDECVAMSEGCCFIGNKCVVPTTHLPGVGFDWKVVGGKTKYCSYGDRFWNLISVSVVQIDNPTFYYGSTRWYGDNYEKFTKALSGGCNDYVTYLKEDLIVTAPKYSEDDGNRAKWDSNAVAATDYNEVSVPINTPGRTQRPQRTNKGRTAFLTEKMNVFTISVVPYKIVTSFTATHAFTKSSQFSQPGSFTKTDKFTKTSAFTETAGFAQSNAFTVSKVFSVSADLPKSSAFSSSHSFKQTGKFTKSSLFTRSGLFAQSAHFAASLLFTTTEMFSESKVFTKTGVFTDTLRFSASAALTESSHFAPTGTFSSTMTFVASSAFTATVEFTKTGTFSETNAFTISRNFASTGHFSASGTFTPAATRTPPPEFMSIVKSAVASNTLSMTMSLQAESTVVEEMSNWVVVGQDGKESVTHSLVRMVSMVYAEVELPVYVVTQSYVELLIVPETRNPLGMSNTLFIGMVTGCAMVIALMGYMVVWFIRSRNEQSYSFEYSNDSDMDNDWARDDEVVRNGVVEWADRENRSDDDWLDDL